MTEATTDLTQIPETPKPGFRAQLYQQTLTLREVGRDLQECYKEDLSISVAVPATLSIFSTVVGRAVANMAAVTNSPTMDAVLAIMAAGTLLAAPAFVVVNAVCGDLKRKKATIPSFIAGLLMCTLVPATTIYQIAKGPPSPELMPKTEMVERIAGLMPGRDKSLLAVGHRLTEVQADAVWQEIMDGNYRFKPTDSQTQRPLTPEVLGIMVEMAQR